MRPGSGVLARRSGECWLGREQAASSGVGAAGQGGTALGVGVGLGEGEEGGCWPGELG